MEGLACGERPLKEPCLFERRIRAVLADGLESFGGNRHDNCFVEFGDEDLFGGQVDLTATLARRIELRRAGAV